MMRAKCYHPLSMLFDLWAFLKNSIIFIIYLFVINLNSQSNFVKYGRIAFGIIVMITLVSIILKWRTHKHELDEQAFHPSTFKPFQGKPTGLLSDGDVVDIGSRKLIIYHTPGHSPGHICIFDRSTGYLFTGDLLYDETPIYAFYPTTNPQDLVESLDKISNIANVKKIFGGHHTLGLEPTIYKK